MKRGMLSGELFQPISTSALCKTRHRERGSTPSRALGLPSSCWGQSDCWARPAQVMSQSWDTEHTAILTGSGHAALSLLFVTSWTVFQRSPSWVSLACLARLPTPHTRLWGLQLKTSINEVISSHQLSQAASAPLYCVFVCPQPLRTC